MNDQKRQAVNDTAAGTDDPSKPRFWKMLLKREICRLEAGIPTTNTTERNALWLEQIGWSIEAAAERIQPGADRTIIVNIKTGNKETISLNTKLSALENAALYLKKAKKAQKSEALQSGNANQTAQSLLSLKKAYDRICRLNDASDPSDTIAAIATAAEALRPILPGISIPGFDTSAGQETSIPYRHVKIDGWDIYLGRTETENDELSIRFAAPADLWFHAAGCPGSHCIIRRPKGAPPPPPMVIGAAASLAAWYSKARNAPLAEVHTTEARFVGKRSGAPAGEVTLEHWKSIKAVPKGPDHHDFSDRSS